MKGIHMEFFSKLGAFINNQASDWRVFHGYEKHYLNSPAGLAKSCGKGVVHWAFSSLFAIYFGVSLLYDGRMTEIPAQDIIFSSCFIMAGFMLLQLVFDYLFKRLSTKRLLGYILGAAIMIWNLSDILQFSTKATLQYLIYLFTPWFLCESVAYMLGPWLPIDR